jgi:glycosyltransferase involved in cell wall biosynthesis
MKIGFDAKRLFHNFTGLGNYSRWMVRALQARYPENEYLLFAPRVRPAPETADFLRAPYRLFTSGYPRALHGFWRSVDMARIARQQGVTLLHGLSNELPLRKPASQKMICTVHDLIFLRYPDLYNPIDRQIYTWKLKTAVRNADRIVCVSRQTAADLETVFPAARDRVRVVYQGCHAAFYQRFNAQQLQAVREKYRLPEDFVLTVGTLERRKNAALLLRALARMKGSTAALLVGRPTHYQKELDELVRAHRLESRVHFLHRVAHTDLPLIYQSARALVYPSRYEGFGIPILEAMASGLPVVASRLEVFSEVAGPDNWYVDADDADELANTLGRLLSNESETRARVARAALHLARFSEAHVADELMRVYREV